MGVTAMARGESFELTDLLAAADSAMYAAKQAGRNQVAFAPPLRDMGLDAAGLAPEAGSARKGRPRPRPSPRARPGASPMSSHRVVLVRRSKPPFLYALEGNSPCSLGHCMRPNSASAICRPLPAMYKCTCRAVGDGRTLACRTENCQV